MRRTAILALVLAATGVGAVDLSLPQGARLTATRDSALAQVAVPLSPFGADGLESATYEGPVRRRAYRLPTQGLTPLQILAPLRAQLEESGYEVVLDCNQDSCGGFDFRFAIEVLPAPNLYVNIRAYHFLTALSDDGSEAVMLLASAADTAGYLQVISAGDTQISAPDVPPSEPALIADTPAVPDGFAEALLAGGSKALDSLVFATGTTSLSDTPSLELEELAQLLADRPRLRIAVVGHTDTVGGLEANINVSRARAEAVRTRLIADYGVNPAQVEAAGMGYLAPRASNLSASGREANRRVEVIVVREEDG